MKKSVLIIGSGGREHALGWKLAQSPKVGKIYFAPGNGGTSEIGENVALDISKNKEVVDFSKKNKIDLVVVAPDDPLAEGLVNDLTKAKIAAFGPTREASRIEWSKSFAKDLMKSEKIPTAKYEKFTDIAKAKKYIQKHSYPLVIKASGLALGKGVIIAQNKKVAENTLEEIMVKKVFGAAGDEVVIEEFLQGAEISIHAFCDGKTAVLFPTAQDHKPIFEKDKGPNTGGMGTIAPLSWTDERLMKEVRAKIVDSVLKGLKKKGATYKGLLYPGLMVTKSGPKVLEFNARFGDPETQSYLRLLKTDLYDIFMACVNGTLDKVKIQWADKVACCIVLASKGYPGSYPKGVSIKGLDKAAQQKDVVVFHAGTKKDNGNTVTNGGRVLGVTATGTNLKETLKKAHAAIKLIHFDGMQYRKDIGLRKPPKF